MKKLKEKTKSFAIRILKMSKFLRKYKREEELIQKTVIAGTSIGAKVASAEFSPDKDDFVNTILLAIKEATIAINGLNMLFKAEMLSKEAFDSLLNEATEIHKMLVAIVKNSKDKE
jgi:four helix bundle protein